MMNFNFYLLSTVHLDPQIDNQIGFLTGETCNGRKNYFEWLSNIHPDPQIDNRIGFITGNNYVVRSCRGRSRSRRRLWREL